LPVPSRWIGREVFAPLAETLGLVRCNACRLVYVNPRPSDRTLAAFYDRDDYGFHGGDASAASGARADFFLQRILRHLPPTAPRTLLDYGAGGGGFLKHARERGWQVRGFEPARRGIASCRAAGLDVTDCLDDLPSAEFGVITVHHVLEHVPNPGDVLRQMRRLLAADGRLYVEVPNARSLRAHLSFPLLSRHFPIDERYRAYPIHLLYYSPQTLQQQLAKAGWSVEHLFTIGLGIDELVARDTCEAEQPARPTDGVIASNTALPARRRLRHALRDCFLDACLGENLGAVARIAHA
jgi:2-polyprenyl-3-methyl-5-hydroxy-6-metoxy-1,4-benzoquinol methylase